MLFRLWRERKARNEYTVEALAWLIKRMDEMSVSLQDIRDQIAAEKNVVSSAVLLLQALKARLADVSSNTDLSVLKSDLDTMIQPLAEAVAAGTSAASDATKTDPAPATDAPATDTPPTA